MSLDTLTGVTQIFFKLLTSFTLLSLSLAPLSYAQSNLYPLPEDRYQYQNGSMTFMIGAETISYIEGVGWTKTVPYADPIVRDGKLYGDAQLLNALTGTSTLPATSAPTPAPNTTIPGATLPGTTPAISGPPRVTDVRFGGQGSIRLVIDLAGISQAQLGNIETSGKLSNGNNLSVRLPALNLPTDPPEPYRDIDVSFQSTPTATALNIKGPDMNYHVFTLENPTRVVVDMVPLVSASVTEETRELRPGVVYKRFAAPTQIGSSGVHVLEINPAFGEFRVVGEREQARTVSDLASGAFAAINAGYYDTSTLDPIGLLKVDYGLVSLPSRNRASIGFGYGQPVIGRVEATLNVRVNNQLFYSGSLTDTETIAVHTSSGVAVGDGSKGVITVQNGVVLENKIGPRVVPEDGFAIVYAPGIRALALVNKGNLAAIEVDFNPDVFEQVKYAVEAGPLLVEHGLPAFEPETEKFRRGERILDQYTQQAAIGVRADGTVLLVTADNMIAQELVPVMMSLGAERAMRLDSGGSTTLYADGQVLNTNYQRKVVSAIVFVPNSLE